MVKNRLIEGWINRLADWVSGDWLRPHWRIVYYHAILENHKQRFADQLDWLSEHFEWCTVSHGLEAMTHGGLDRPLLSLTFDDADETVYTNAMPLLARRGIRACIYVVPTYVDRGESFRDRKPRPIMTWDQIKGWIDEGHEVGSHTYTHANCPRCVRERLEQEAVWSRNAIQERLGIKVAHFAYPWGQHDATTEAILRDTGCFASIAATQRGAMENGSNPYCLRRDRMDLSKTPEYAGAIMKLADRFYELRNLRKLDPRRMMRSKSIGSWPALRSNQLQDVDVQRL